MDRRLLIAAAVVVAAGVGVFAWLRSDEPDKKRGSATVQFDTTAAPERERPKPPPENPTPWPTYAYDVQRTHLSPYDHRPPFRTVWRIDARDTIEFPPAVGFGKAFLAQQKGLFFALDSRTGRVAWKRNFRRCAASSPTLADGVVYQAYMDYVNCPQDRSGATGFLIAMDARTGRRRWIFRTAPIESSPLLVRGTLYVGDWDHKVYAIDARTGRKRWEASVDDQANTSAAYSKGRIYIGTDAGSLYAFDARTGKQRWKSGPGGEFFYATPTVAYGRVFIGNTNGTMYAYGARTGDLLWARPSGTYVYSAAAVADRRVFFGTYDGKVYALDAATGDVRWQRDAPAAVHSPPTVMGGLVYFATCSSCGRIAARSVKGGPDGTVAYSARTGRLRWRSRAGKFANPIVADPRRVYLAGRSFLYGLAQRKQSRDRRSRRRP